MVAYTKSWWFKMEC